MTHTALPAVPNVRLYVEERTGQEQRFVNVGHVTDRGRWRTAPHVHPGYGQVIFVRNGRGVMNLEGRRVPFEAPCALLLPTGCVHGLEYEIDVDRWVVTVETAYLAQINGKLRQFIRLWSTPRVIPFEGASDRAAEFHGLIRRLQHETAGMAAGHVIGTEALLTLLLLVLLRGARLDDAANEPSIGNATSQEIRLTERFRELIERHYRDNLQLQAYTSLLCVSQAQLRAACAAATGHSPMKLIHARIVTEAKRHLIFGDATMEQIAFALGFADAAYFTRFFRKQVGQAPSQFRLATRGQSDGMSTARFPPAAASSPVNRSTG